MTLPGVHYARGLRFDLRLKGPIDLDKVARELGLSVFEEPLDAEAYLIRSAEQARILINSQICYPARARFTLAHEVGHFLMPHHRGDVFRCLAAELERYHSRDNNEREANEFASELLLPSEELASILGHPPTMNTLSAISDTYGTSLTATALKVADVTCERLAVVLSEAGRTKWCRRSRSFPFWVREGPVPRGSQAGEYFANRTVVADRESLPVDVWCDRAPRGTQMVEESVVFERLNMVLTLLHIPVDADAEDELYDGY